jgi:nucleoside-diphosphate-sugar epimerase
MIYRRGIHLIPTCVPPRLSFIHHLDLIELLVRVAGQGTRIAPRSGSSSTAGYYFAGDPQPLTYEQLGRLIADGFGRPHPLMFYFAEPFLWLAAAGNELAARLRGRVDTFNTDKIREAIAGDWVTSPRTAERDLEFAPACPLAERFRQTANWYLEHGWL